MFSKQKIINLIAIISVIYLLISLNPFLLWIIWPGFINFPLFAGIILATMVVIKLNLYKIDKTKVLFSIPILCFMLHLGTPLLGGEGFDIGKLMSFSSLVLILFYNSYLHSLIFKYLTTTFLFISWFAIVIFMITLVGIDLPYYKIEAQTLVMLNSFGGESFYKLYGLVVSSTNTVYNVGGLNIARICGPFQEPGHFAIYLGLITFFQKIIFNKISLGFILAGILTLSPNYLIFLVIAFFYDFIYSKNRSKTLMYLFGSFIGVSFLLMASETIRDELIFLMLGRNFDNSGTDIVQLLDDRAGKQTLAYYESFVNTSYVYFGRGVEFMSQYGVLSDWRGMVLKFGLIGLFFSVLASIRILFFTNIKMLKFFVALMLLIIYLQRSWMFESTFVYLFTIIGLISFQFNLKKNRLES